MKISIFLCILCVAVSAAVKVTVKDLTVMEGENAVLPCEYESTIELSNDSLPENDANPTITWYAVDGTTTQRLAVYKKGDATNTYVDKEAGRTDISIQDGSLVIENTKLEDNKNLKKLRCYVELGQGDDSGEADLEFVVAKLPSSEPVVSINDYGADQTGFSIDTHKTNIGTCVGGFSFPDAIITFYKRNKDGLSLKKLDGEAALQAFFDPTSYIESTDGVSRATKKDLLKILEPSDHQAEFLCSLEIDYGDKKFVQNKTMPKFNVNHPTTKAVIKSDSEFAYAGSSVTLSCETNGFPEPTILINGEETSSKTFEVTKEMDGKVFECLAENEGSDEVRAEYTLEVLSVDEPVVEGDSQVTEGDSVTITCTAAGDPMPNIAWFRDDVKVADGGVLTLEKISFDATGIYTCQADNGHEQLKRISDFSLNVEGIILTGEAEVNVEGGKDDVVTLTCEVQANPEATIEWDDSSLDATFIKTGYSYSSDVMVGPLSPKMSEKTYTCTATSGDQTVIKTFKLPQIKGNSTKSEVIEEPASATAAIIIVILVIILIVAIILAVLYNRGIICKKQEKGEESADGDIAAVDINNEDVEAGNGKPDDGPSPPEEEKLVNGDSANE